MRSVQENQKGEKIKPSFVGRREEQVTTSPQKQEMEATLASRLNNVKRAAYEDDDDDDDMPALSAHALLALNEFLSAQTQQAKAPAEVAVVEEDWQLSQFWYTEETARTIAEEVREQAGAGGRVAFLSTPTAFIALKKLLNEKGAREEVELVLFEYDRRFERAYPDEFVFYDYKHPTAFGDESNNSSQFKAGFDMVLIDPPFLNEECMSQYMETVRLLAKPSARFLAATGRVMTDYLMAQENVGCGAIRECQWRPRHNKLSNEFKCYTNYASTRLNLEGSDASPNA